MNRLLFFIAVAVLTSCATPYESVVPISRNGNVAMDTLLMGYWKTVSYGDDTTTHMIKISPIDASRVHIDYVAIEDEPLWKSGWLSYLAHHTVINETTYTNLKILDGDNIEKAAYNFAKYEIVNDSLHVSLLTNKFEEHFVKPKDFRKYVKKNQKAFDDCFEDFLRLERITK